MEDGRELPLFKLETTSESHPFYTGTQKSIDNLGGRVEKFRNKFAKLGLPRSDRPHGRHDQGQPRLPFFCRRRLARSACHRCSARDFRHPRPRDPARRQRLPRLALLLFCAAYVLPGLFGRDPWRNADLTAFGYMARIAEGRSAWLAPTHRRPAARHRAAAALAWRGQHLGCCRPGRRTAWRHAFRSRLLLAGVAGADLVHAPTIWPAPRRRSRWHSPSAARPSRSTMPAPWPTARCWR